MNKAIAIILTRSPDGRRWLATFPNDGTATGRGDTAGQAVDDLLRWSPARQEAASRQQSDG